MEPVRGLTLNGFKLPVAGGSILLALAGGGWTLHDQVATLRADQAVNRSMAINLAGRMDTLELKIESVRIAPTGISAETRPRLDTLDEEVRGLRARVRELERSTP